MARPSWSNCRRLERGLLIALCVLASAACVRMPQHADDTWKAAVHDAAAADLAALREHLALAPAERIAERENLRRRAARGDSVAERRYMFMLSLARDDIAELQQARDYFRRALAATAPLPLALDALIRLQLGQVEMRLDDLQSRNRSARACASASRESEDCTARLESSEQRAEALRQQLSEVRRKLDALARIEQTVNQQQEQQDIKLPADTHEESDDDAEQATDSAGR